MGKLNDYRILTAGQSEGVDEAMTKLILLRVWEATRPLRQDGAEVILVHPVDAFGEQVAKEWISLGGASEPHTGDWETFGKQAPFVRNQEMVDAGADLCIVFIGTTNSPAHRLAALAEAAGILTWRIES